MPGRQLRRSADGGRHVDVGVYGDYAFVNRGYTAGLDTSDRWQESRTPFDLSARTVRLRVPVERTSVEMFVDDGRYAHWTVVSSPTCPTPGRPCSPSTGRRCSGTW
ncbi:hypothetical protein AQJ46_39710 [Streptomyces canus]|uniref:Glycosyl hydrolase family 32 C-terminal domain-containing protein n=1 Tax=Streptomyces canus TaxID=58343 RepID=A0A101RPE5_9ACTN|nr:hypothetical protein AQJ46_39710 [Streptomyces canus]